MRFFIYVAFCVLATGCGQANQVSQLKIINGIDINGINDQFPAVVQIKNSEGAGCTASFVSERTLLTAAHCLEGSYGDITVGESLVASQFYMHPGYYSEWYKHDIAVITFSEDVSEDFVEVGQKRPVVGDSLEIVGYGINNLYSSNPSTSKRMGKNLIDYVANGRIIFHGFDSLHTGSRENSLSAPGDSGGPMFVDGLQVGVSSSISSQTSNTERSANYTDINYPENIEFLKRLVRDQGVDIQFSEL